MKQKKHKAIEKVEMSKMPTVNPLFLRNIIYTLCIYAYVYMYIMYILYIHNKFVIEKWVNCHHFFIDEKHLQKFDQTGEVISV